MMVVGLPATRGGVAGRAVTTLAIRDVRRGVVLVAASVAGLSALVAVQYRTTFAGALDGPAMRALTDNPAIRILFGPPLALDDPGGFTVWRTGTPASVIVAVWALLVATRISRGEEDGGRWDLLLAGRLRAVDLVVRGLITLAAGAALIGGSVAVAMVAAGTSTTGALVHGTGIAAVATVFVCAGMLAAQLLPSRSVAAGATAGLLGLWLALRMLADGVSELGWGAWFTPFGLTARSAPFADDRTAPLLVLFGFTVLVAAAAVVAARRRDIGGAVLSVPVTRPPRARLLGSLTGFAVRRALLSTAGWATGIAAYFLLVGVLISSILSFLAENPRFAELAAAAGFDGLDTADGVAAAMFGLLAIPVGLYAVTRLGVMAADEKARRWTAIYSLPVSRASLAATETAVTAAGAAILLLAAALAMWAGAVITDAPLGLSAAIAGAANVAPIAMLALGAAAVALGWYPTLVGTVGALPVVGGFVLVAIGPSIGAPDWLIACSPFQHLAAVPEASPDWTATLALMTIAAILAAIGLHGYARRDVAS